MFNNRKANRFSKRKYRINIISQDLFIKWKTLTNSTITFSEFKKYWKLIAKEYENSITEEKDGVRLSSGLGDLYIGYISNPKKRGIDYKTSEKVQKIVYYENWNTSGKLGKIIHGTTGRRYIYRYSRYWSFKACTTFKAAVKKALRNFPERFKNSIEKRSLK